MSAGKQSVLNELKPLLRPVIGLAENLPKKDLEHITVEALRKHRRLRHEVELLEASLAKQPSKLGDTLGPSGPTRLTWADAMMQMHMQQTLLSTLLDVLGYVPDVPDDDIS